MKSEVDDLHEQVHILQQKLSDLHAGDVNTLNRALRSLAQHVDTLAIEMQAVHSSASRMHGSLKTPPDVIAIQAAQTCGILWAGHIFCWFSRHTFKTGKAASRIVMILSAAAAISQLAYKGGKRLVGLVATNTQVVDELRLNLRVIEERISIMSALTSHNPLESSGVPPPNPAGAPPPGDRTPVATASPSTDDEGILVNADMVQEPTTASTTRIVDVSKGGGVDSVVTLGGTEWESPRRQAGTVWVDAGDSTGGRVAVSEVAGGGTDGTALAFSQDDSGGGSV